MNDVPKVTSELRRLDVETGESVVVATRQVDAPYRVEQRDDGSYWIFRHGSEIAAGVARELDAAVMLWAGTIQRLDQAEAEIKRLKAELFAMEERANHPHGDPRDER